MNEQNESIMRPDNDHEASELHRARRAVMGALAELRIGHIL